MQKWKATQLHAIYSWELKKRQVYRSLVRRSGPEDHMLESLIYSFLEARGLPWVLAYLTVWTSGAAPHCWEMGAHRSSVTTLSPYHVPNISNTYMRLPFPFITGRWDSITVSTCPHCKDGNRDSGLKTGCCKQRVSQWRGRDQKLGVLPHFLIYAASTFYTFALDPSPTWSSFPCYSNSVST